MMTINYKEEINEPAVVFEEIEETNLDLRNNTGSFCLSKKIYGAFDCFILKVFD